MLQYCTSNSPGSSTADIGQGMEFWTLLREFPWAATPPLLLSELSWTSPAIEMYTAAIAAADTIAAPSPPFHSGRPSMQEQIHRRRRTDGFFCASDGQTIENVAMEGDGKEGYIATWAKATLNFLINLIKKV